MSRKRSREELKAIHAKANRASRGRSSQKWFKEAVEAKPPYTISSWTASSPAKKRRRACMLSCPDNWTTKHKYRRCARALQALANVTKDRKTAAAARPDSQYFWDRYHAAK